VQATTLTEAAMRSWAQPGMAPTSGIGSSARLASSNVSCVSRAREALAACGQALRAWSATSAVPRGCPNCVSRVSHLSDTMAVFGMSARHDGQQ